MAFQKSQDRFILFIRLYKLYKYMLFHLCIPTKVVNLRLFSIKVLDKFGNLRYNIFVRYRATRKGESKCSSRLAM